MTPAKIALFSALAAATVTSGWQWHRQTMHEQETRRLRAENERLRMVIAPDEDEGTRGDRPSATSSSARTDGESTGVELDAMKSAASAATTAAAAAGRALANTDYRNEGQATPAAAMQTLAWACDHADMALMERLLVFDEDAREKAQRIFETRRAKFPSQWTTIQSMAAALYLADGIERPYPVASVLSVAKFEELRPGRVRLHLPGSNGDRYEFEHTADGWKLVVTMAVVDNYIRQSAKDASGR